MHSHPRFVRFAFLALLSAVPACSARDSLLETAAGGMHAGAGGMHGGADSGGSSTDGGTTAAGNHAGGADAQATGGASVGTGGALHSGGTGDGGAPHSGGSGDGGALHSGGTSEAGASNGGNAGAGHGGANGGSAGAGHGGANGGSAGAGHGGANGGSAGAAGSAGAGGCPSGQTWCPGCTSGSGSCSVVCPAAPCPSCSSVTTLNECELRSDCHSVFTDPGTCGCAAVGCCARFSRCADGDLAVCTPPQTFACTTAEPFCESPAYVHSYANSCYEGCVAPKDCAP